MNMENLSKELDDFLGKKEIVKNKLGDGTEEVCNLATGECYIIKSKDGIVERINKKFITEDGRQLLDD